MRMESRRERSAVAGLCSLLAVLVLACQPPTPAALEDTPENRAAQIDRYLAAQPPEQMLQDMVGKMSARMPEEQRAQFVELMTKQLDVAKLDTAMRESMAKHFTADELRALADFYGSALGKSAMAKFGAYMADVMPTIQSEIMAAVGRAQSEFAAQQQQQQQPLEQQGQEQEQPPAPAAAPPKG